MHPREDTEKIVEAYRLRVGGLRRFAVAITVLNILGHLFLGFEQSYAQPIVALATAYSLELLMEVASARTENRPYRFAGGIRSIVDFMLPSHITALAVAMLLYANDTLFPVAFATAAAIGSKSIFRARIGNGKRHIFNPSNFGISLTLVLFAWVGIAPPYQFTENIDTVGDWLLPAFIIFSGTLLNGLFTKRLLLIATWLLGFLGQALIRNLVFETPLTAALLPMSGVAFILYTFYMITDPATTPSSRLGQVFFGVTNAAVYGFLMISHVVFGLFFALSITCSLRGVMLYAHNWNRSRASAKEPEFQATSAQATAVLLDH